MQQNHYLVPSQLVGTGKDIVYTISSSSLDDAIDWFVDAKERLLDVNNWQKYSGAEKIFSLADAHGKLLRRKAHKKDHVIIGNIALGESHKIMVVESLEYDDYPDIDMETFAMRLHNIPAEAGELVPKSSATIAIERIAKKLSAFYHSRNEPLATGIITSFDQPDNLWACLIKGLIG